jgi:hypothetical protein
MFYQLVTEALFLPYLTRASRVLAKKQKTKPTKGVFPMQQLSKQPAFELGQIVATPGALAALEKSGQQPGEFLTRLGRRWRACRKPQVSFKCL